MWKTITLQRVVSLISSLFSEKLSILIKKPILWGFPPVISIEPTAYCNLHCPECPSGNGDLLRNRGYMKLELFKKILAEISARSFAIQFFFQGEPFLNKQLLEMIRLASAKHLYTIVSTNGHFIKEQAASLPSSGLNKLIISIDGMKQESYQHYRQGGDIELVKKGIARLIEEKKKQKTTLPQIELQFIVFEHNEHEIEPFKQWCKEIRVKGVLKTAQITHLNKKQINPPKNSSLSRYKKQNEKWVIKKKETNSCLRLWTNPVICWDGKIAVCCYDKDASFNIGNVSNSAFIDSWKSPVFQNFRKGIITKQDIPPMCANCNK